MQFLLDTDRILRRKELLHWLLAIIHLRVKSLPPIAQDCVLGPGRLLQRFPLESALKRIECRGAK